MDEKNQNTETEVEQVQGVQESAPEAKPLEEMSREELIESAAQAREEAEKNFDRYLRAQAEIENIRKRSRREREDYIKFANETLIKELLPVVDNLESALSHITSGNEHAVEALREGVELTLKGLKETLSKSGLEDVKTDGEPFDPNFHEAVAQQADEEVEAGMILKELQKGYILNNRLVRPAIVVVSKGKPVHETAEGESS